MRDIYRQAEKNETNIAVLSPLQRNHLPTCSVHVLSQILHWAEMCSPFTFFPVHVSGAATDRTNREHYSNATFQRTGSANHFMHRNSSWDKLQRASSSSSNATFQRTTSADHFLRRVNSADKLQRASSSQNSEVLNRCASHDELQSSERS